MKRIIYFALLVLCPLFAMAQKVALQGNVIDGAAGEGLPGATVVLLQPKDSVQVTGASTDADGNYKLPAVKVGPYIMRISYMGYRTYYRNISLPKGNKTLNLGSVTLEEDSKLMKETEVVAKLAQVEMKEDTFVYNSDAYRLPEGSVLEELVKKLPGAEVDDEGNIKINGKAVTKIMVEGKDFFESDTKMAMKNLPTKMIKKIKAYDKKSDYSRITGIDDGDEQTVLDLTVQKGMKNSWVSNLDLGYGTHERYTAKLMLNRFMDHSQFSLIGSRNNVNDNGFPGGGGRGGWGGGGGITTSTMVGANFAWENGKKEDEAGYFETGGSVRYFNRQSFSETKSNSEMFLSDTKSTFSNSFNSSNNRNWNVGVNFRFEWMADSMTNIMFRPGFSHSSNDGRSLSNSVTFNDNPYATYDGRGMKDPLLEYDLEENRTILQQIGVNDNRSTSKSEGVSNNINGSLQVNRRLAKPGRNIALNLSAGYNDSDNSSFSRSKIRYFQQQTGGGMEGNNRKPNFTNQYNVSPSKSYDYSARASYSEPIVGALNLQFSYQFQYRYSDSDRSMYSIDSLLSKYEGYYTEEQLYLGYIPGLDTLNYIRNVENSQYATYNEYNHDASLMLRYNVGDNRLNVGVSFQPQKTFMDYKRGGLDTTVVRNTLNWSPRVDYRWKISNVSQLRVRFNGRMSQPSMTDLLEVANTSNPLRISTGNSGLRSSWNNRFDVFYNGGITDLQMNWSVNANYNQTRNSISTADVYDVETGAHYTRPMNIDGNWNAGGNLMFSSALGSSKAWNVNTFTNFSYSNRVGYMNSNVDGINVGNIFNDNGTLNYTNFSRIFDTANLREAVTKGTNIGENLRLSYRNDIVEVGTNGGFNYQHDRSTLQQNANRDVWNFNYGGNLVLNLPWGMAFSSDISEQCRRGYDDASMNTNELIWNAQLSQSFLKGRAATVSVQCFDILKQRSSISRNISATMRTDTWTNAIHSYFMVHFIYRLNVFGNKEARQEGFGGFGGGRGGNWGGRGGWGGGGRF